MNDENFEWTSEPYGLPRQQLLENLSVPPIPRKKTRRGSRGGRGKKKANQQTVPTVLTAQQVSQPTTEPNKPRRRGSRGGKNRRKNKVVDQDLTYPSFVPDVFGTDSPEEKPTERTQEDISLLDKWTSLSGTSRRYGVAVSITFLTLALSLLLRNSDEEITLRILKQSWTLEKQFVLLLWSVLVVPVLSSTLSWIGKNRFYSAELEASPAFTYFQTTEKLLTILSSVLTFVLNYILIALVAWKNIQLNPPLESLPDHWYWVDRQTVAFIVTLIVSILAAMLTNASKDLSGANERTKNEFISVSNQARHLIAQIHQNSEFLWDEFEETFKSSGKWFLYTANSHLKCPDRTDATDILEYISTTLLGATLNDEIDALISSRLNDLSAEQSFQFNWSDPKWARFFNQRDFLQLLPNQKPNLDQLINAAQVPLTQADHLALDIANRINISSSDGRFCLVDSLDEKTKSFGLIFQRRVNGICKKIKTKNGEDWVYGYFPTDSSLTLEILSRMLENSRSSLQNDKIEDFHFWFLETYALLQNFASKNKNKLDNLKNQIATLENLLSSYAIPMSLLTDDALLLTTILDTGTDQSFDGKSLDDQQLCTLARFLTYSSAYYWGQVWNQGKDRQLPINFPSPFANVRQRTDSHRRHSARRFEEFRKALEYKLLEISEKKKGENFPFNQRSSEDWAITLEILNSQSPIMNWIKAGHAYVTREAFLSADIETPLMDGVIESPIEIGVRQKLLGVFFRSDALDESVDNYLERQRIMSLSQRIDGTPEVLIDITTRAENVARRISGHGNYVSNRLPLLFGDGQQDDEIIKQAASLIIGPVPLRVGAKSQIKTVVPSTKIRFKVLNEQNHD
jgi:hypothetical protein